MWLGRLSAWMSIIYCMDPDKELMLGESNKPAFCYYKKPDCEPINNSLC